MSLRAAGLGLVVFLGVGCPSGDRPAECRCPAGEECDPSGVCVAVQVPDAGSGCRVDRDCGALAPRCSVERGECVGCLGDSDCSLGYCEVGTLTCQALPDTCASAKTIVVGASPVVLRGNTARASDDMVASCALPSSRGPDLVYRLELSQKKRLVVQIEPDDPAAFQPALALRAACDSSALKDNLGCAFKAPNAAHARLSVDGLPAGDYWLWVDGEGRSAGAFTLTVTSEDPPQGDSCTRPHPLGVFTGARTLVDDTRSYKHDTAGGCGGSGAADVVYELELAEPKRVSATLTPRDAAYVPVLYLARSPCEQYTSTQLACVRPAGPTAVPVQLDLPRLEKGHYFLFVDGALGRDLLPTAGAYTLQVDVQDPLPVPVNDSCRSPEILSLPIGGLGTLTATGDTTHAVSDSSSCDGAGPDVVYQLTLPAPRQVLARVTPAAGSQLRPSVYLRRARCDTTAAADLMGCSAASTSATSAVLNPSTLAAGDYFLWIDGVGGSKGAYTLSVEVLLPVPKPGNDSCASPQLLTAPATVNATTTGAANDHTSCEVPFGSAGPDVVYELRLATKQAVDVDLVAPQASNTLKPVLTLMRPGKCSSSSYLDEVFCAWADPQLPERAVYSLGSLDPGSYFLWVDGDDASHGPFTLRVATSAPVSAPPNDSCSGTLPTLVFGQSVVGDTRSARDDDFGVCAVPYGAAGELAPDVVFRFTLATARAVALTVTPDSNEGQLLRPVVYLRGPVATSCTSYLTADQVECRVATSFGGQVALNLPSLAAGQYFLWVDGAGNSAGKFAVRLQ